MRPPECRGQRLVDDSHNDRIPWRRDRSLPAAASNATKNARAIPWDTADLRAAERSAVE